MAKKTASKKKLISAKAKAVKVKTKVKVKVKTKVKTKVKVKTAKPTIVKKTLKPAKPVLKLNKKLLTKKATPVKHSKPALMTNKGKKAAEIEVAPESPMSIKPQTIVSMMESELPASSILKVEKISKAKSIKIDRGNLADEKAKWAELNKKYAKETALNYKMTEIYPALAPLEHKVLGWGYILSNENDRLEVLFENGIRMLISNYKN